MSLNFPEAFQQLNSLPNPSNVLMSTFNKSLQSNYNQNQFLPTQQHSHLNESAEIYRHVCRVCGKNFRASSLLDIHMRVHVGAKPFVCPVCNHRATQKGNLKLHMKKHHGQDLPPDIDIIPDSGIWGNFDKKSVNTSVDAKQAHSSLLDPEIVELIKKCQNNVGQSSMGRITESLTDFVEMAQNVLPVKTDKPSFKTWKWDNLNQNNNGHGLSQSQKDELHNAAMNICKRFVQSNSQTTQSHQAAKTEARNKKPEGKGCSCKVCGWETTSVGYLNVHMRKHKAESHVCSVCGRAFKETWYLKNHMRSHINDLAHTPNDALPNSVAHLVKTEYDIAQQNQPPCNDVGKSITPEPSTKVQVVSLFSECDWCGQVFENMLLESHMMQCGSVKAKYPFDSNGDEKSLFMQSLGLFEQDKLPTQTKMVAKVSDLNPLIACLTHDDSTQSRQVVHDKLSILPKGKQVLKHELLKSISQHQLDISLSLKPSVQDVDHRSSDTLEGSVQTCGVNGTKSSMLPGHRGKINGVLPTSEEPQQMLLSQSQLRPYRNPAILSLAEIGKTFVTQSIQNNATPVPVTVTSGNQIEENHEPPPVRTRQGFQCRFCLKWFKYRSVLGIHMRSHTGERPYKCTYCGYAGTQHNCLKLHMQRHHPKEYIETHNNLILQNKIHMQSANKASKAINSRDEDLLNEQAAKFSPARCPVCGRVSPSPGYLKIHMRSHKKTLDHVCNICGRGFKEYWYLSTHLRTHSRETDFSQKHTMVQRPTQVGFASKRDELLSKSRSNMNNVLSKTISAPDPPVNEQLRNSGSDHSVLTPALSWDPSVSTLQPIQEGYHLPAFMDNIQHIGQRPTAALHVSKRKAFQPARYKSEPYPTHCDADGIVAPTRSRKSKPRKIIQSSYMNPVFRQLSLADDAYNKHTVQDMEYEENDFDKHCSEDEEKPLDLSVTTAMLPYPPSGREEERADDEPLNLVIK